ncbi:hypothetical protein NLU13_7354 [Sarocladium strictum]|uniref:NAD(P)-binding domain-containing protein n=1 Tax=Sarocladium strictum TaxID=5046 RepID=A0AA39GCZ1_SARSR|nr:hypothetical protein NLU13_7354 [Sarocladium strictum]
MLVKIMETTPSPLQFLILGAGWTSQYLIPELEREGVEFAATTTDGRNGTIPFKFDPESEDLTPFRRLPDADTVLITFPLQGKGQSRLLTTNYLNSRSSAGRCSSGRDHHPKPKFIQLGTTSIWTGPGWHDDQSPYNEKAPRAIAEDELLNQTEVSATVLNLAGLYGGSRQPRNWLDRVVKTKEDLKNKGALHVIHGEDVARAVLAVHRSHASGKRYILCDMHVYDWWDLAQDWAILALREVREKGTEGTEEGNEVLRKSTTILRWVHELMTEEGVKALPRDTSAVGRALDGRGFWGDMGILPIHGRIR